MICGNQDIGFKVISRCDDCKIYPKDGIYKLSRLIPQGHCFGLLHSLIPYMVTFKHRGWFKWERTRDRVVVCCPSVKENVCVELKKKSMSGQTEFEYRILKVRGRCKFYKNNEVFKISKRDFGNLCWPLFNIIFPYLKTEHQGVKISCGSAKGKSQFELFKV